MLQRIEQTQKQKTNSLNFKSRILCQAQSISRVACGMTHNYISGRENERLLFEYWDRMQKIRVSSGDDNDLTVILFEIDNIYQLCRTNGNGSRDNTICECGNKIEKYCEWFAKEFGYQWKLFHLDSNPHQFVVLTKYVDSPHKNSKNNTKKTENANSTKRSNNHRQNGQTPLTTPLEIQKTEIIVKKKDKF